MFNRFWLNKEYSSKSLRNFTLKKTKHFIGTLIFASNAALYGFEQYPKDDLESLFYSLIYLKNGNLPWINNKAKHNLAYLEEILNIINNLTLDELFRGFPKEMKFIFKSIMKLSINEIPDYDIYIKNLENSLNEISKQSKIDDNNFIW